ncbi:hypothetical protein [Nonomuraea basaltis]|uniref:hypothetical protein n=1 Tax=Nonomuraea basaltis TaxID=2495887 RepID=UPI00110C5424|nr:hypothetical protein [Nonomuraea basaltis]TMR88615.1 hypothetical protein EJK15_65315 [Nonomuraea basaltis]
MTDWAQVAFVLDQVATLLEQRPDLDADGAIRLLIWGSADAKYPDWPTDESDLYDDVSMALVADHADLYLGRDSDPCPADEINAQQGAQAAGVAAARVSCYVR